MSDSTLLLRRHDTPADADGGHTHPRRPRQQTAPEAVARVARTLFKVVNPVSPTSGQRLLGREVQHYFSDSLLKQTDGPSLTWRLGAAITGGDRLYLQGEVLGVGASTLVTDYVRAFNAQAVDARDPRRAAYVRVLPGSNNPRHFLDQVTASLGAPLTTTELQRRSPGYLAMRLLATMQLRGATSLVIDEVGNAERALIDFIAELLRVLDPTYHVPLEGAGAGAARLGVVLVGHRPPETLFRRNPQALLGLEGNVAMLRRYTTIEQVFEALQMAGIEMDDCGDCTGDEAFASKLLGVTHGISAQMTPLLRLVDAVALRRGCRPDVDVLDTAMKAYRPMVQATSIAGPDETDSPITDAVANTADDASVETDSSHVTARRTGAARAPSMKSIKPGPPRASGRATRKEEIAQRNYDRSVSETERAALTKSKRVVL